MVEAINAQLDAAPRNLKMKAKEIYNVTIKMILGTALDEEKVKQSVIILKITIGITFKHILFNNNILQFYRCTKHFPRHVKRCFVMDRKQHLFI